MSAIQLVVFDMIGTVLRDEHAIEHSLLKAFHSMGLKVSEQQISLVMGLEKKDAIHLLCKQNHYPDSPEMVEMIYASFYQNLVDTYTQNRLPKPFPDAEEIFAWLNEQGIQVALNTGFERKLTQLVLQQVNWENHPHIQKVISADEVMRGRPFPDMIHYLMQQLHVHDSRQVMKVGDTPSDVQEGRNAGCGYVVAVLTGSGIQDALMQAKPDKIINCLSEIKDFCTFI